MFIHEPLWNRSSDFLGIDGWDELPGSIEPSKSSFLHLADGARLQQRACDILFHFALRCNLDRLIIGHQQRGLIDEVHRFFSDSKDCPAWIAFVQNRLPFRERALIGEAAGNHQLETGFNSQPIAQWRERPRNGLSYALGADFASHDRCNAIICRIDRHRDIVLPDGRLLPSNGEVQFADSIDRLERVDSELQIPALTHSLDPLDGHMQTVSLVMAKLIALDSDVSLCPACGPFVQQLIITLLPGSGFTAAHAKDLHSLELYLHIYYEERSLLESIIDA